MRHPRPNGIFKGPHGQPRPAGVEYSRPHPHNRHGHSHNSGGGRVVHDVVHFIIIPLIIGAALGIAASVVGAIVGHFIIFVWRALFRRGQRGQCNNRQRSVEDVKKDGDEKTGLMEVQEAPPVYEDAVMDEKAEQR